MYGWEIVCPSPMTRNAAHGVEHARVRDAPSRELLVHHPLARQTRLGA